MATPRVVRPERNSAKGQTQNKSKGRRQEAVRVQRAPLNYGLAIVLVLLICLGVLMVFSSTYPSMIIKDKAATSEFAEQAIGAAVCIAGIFLIARIDYRMLYNKNLIALLLIIVGGLLVAVFFFPDINGAHRWIKIFGFSLQPSEFAKFGLMLFLAYYCANNRDWYKSLKTWLLPWFVILPYVGLVLAEPNLSTTLVGLLLPCVIMLFIAGMQKIFFFLALGGAGAGALYMVLFTSWRAGRFGAWLDPWSDPRDTGYQIIQSLYALGDGGLFGVGLGNSRQKILHLPYADTDYIFSVIGEEFGFIGAILVILLFLALILFGIRTAMGAPDLFGAYLAAGITVVIALQTFVNIAVVTNSIPSTGVTLPFVSRGLSSLFAFSMGGGVLLSISAYSKRRAPKRARVTEED